MTHTVPVDPRNSVTASVAAKGMSTYARAGKSAVAATTPATVTSASSSATPASTTRVTAAAPTATAAATTARGGTGGRNRCR